MQYKTSVKEVELLQELKNNPFLLAPMAAITDSSFRLFMRRQGAGIVTSELVSANGLQFNSEKTKALMRFSEEERPVGIQLFGERPQALVEAAQYVEELGADFVDLNLGCPVKKVVSKGAGSALLKDPLQLGQILGMIKRAVAIPLTIKIRTGWDQNTRNALDVVQVAYNEGVTWVAIHGRTRSQAYNGRADWDYIAGVKANSPLPIIGNGDITSASMALERLKTSGCDGVMIGRGCLKNPWIFAQCQNLWKGIDIPVLADSYMPLFDYLKDVSREHSDERHVTLQLRKLSAWFSSGLPGSSQFRKDVFTAKGLEETYRVIQNYYSDVNPRLQEDTSHEAFLMGGHG
ncbi:MAG: tRNA dihydrouridine synthase DusB [Bdellovibrionales bacterium]|nr:tRNA dihydrouridine synthase DusB [Bdellovibrionales bacterium]